MFYRVIEAHILKRSKPDYDLSFSYQSHPGQLSIDKAEKKTDSGKYRRMLNTVRKIQKKYKDITLKEEKPAVGIYKGRKEPSLQISLSGPADQVEKMAEEIKNRFDQEAVMSIKDTINWGEKDYLFTVNLPKSLSHKVLGKILDDLSIIGATITLSPYSLQIVTNMTETDTIFKLISKLKENGVEDIKPLIKTVRVRFI